MTLRELMVHLRYSVLRDTASPTLWTDAELKAFLNEAQVNFARRTFCLLDDSSSFTTILTAPNTPQYALDPRIIRIQHAAVAEYDPETQEQTSWGTLRDGTRGQVSRAGWTGRPVLYTTQTATHRLRLWPVPDAEYSIELVVARTPLSKLEIETDECEIPGEEYQLALCDYAAWRALKNNSPEGAQMVPAADFRAAYELVVRDAKRDLATLHQGESAQARGNWTGKMRSVRY